MLGFQNNVTVEGPCHDFKKDKFGYFGYISSHRCLACSTARRQRPASTKSPTTPYYLATLIKCWILRAMDRTRAVSSSGNQIRETTSPSALCLAESVSTTLSARPMANT